MMSVVSYRPCAASTTVWALPMPGKAHRTARPKTGAHLLWFIVVSPFVGELPILIVSRSVSFQHPDSLAGTRGAVVVLVVPVLVVPVLAAARRGLPHPPGARRHRLQ